MKTIKLSVIIGIAVLASSCGGSSPTAPTAPTIATPPAAVMPLALAGQSNALFMRPSLEQQYTNVVGFAQDGSKIAEWSASGAYWAQLAPQLHQPLKAFIWWLGESDTTTPDYMNAEREFFARVRLEANQPNLLIVVCRVVDAQVFAGVRAVQEAYVRSDPRSILVSSDGLEREHPNDLEGSAHLSRAGYDAMVLRILAAISR